MPRQGWTRADLGFSLLVLGATVITRLPFRARMLYNWDAVQFALALNEFDVAKHQPHPPGYVLYVALGRLLNGFLHDPNQSYIALGIICSALTTTVVYLLGTALYGRLTGAAAALLLMVSPLFWFYGEIGLTYSAEALMATTVAFLIHRFRLGEERFLYVSASYLGIAGGFRPTALALLLPLWILGVSWARPTVRKILLAGLLLLLSTLSWFLPMVWLTGGWARYFEASWELFASVVHPTSIFSGNLSLTFGQLRFLLESTLVGLGAFAFVVVSSLWSLWRRGQLMPGRTELFLLAWIIPPALVYVFFHFGQAGYVLSFLPALYLLLARGLLRCIEEWAPLRLAPPRLRWAVSVSAFAVLFLANTAFFVNAKPGEFPEKGADGSTVAGLIRAVQVDSQHWLLSGTAAGLKENDWVIRTYVEAIRGLFPPGETALITELGNPRSYTWLRHITYYLPEYPVYMIQLGPGPQRYLAPHLVSAMVSIPSPVVPLPWNTRRLVWVVDRFHPDLEPPRGLKEIGLPHGRYLYVLELRQRAVSYAGYAFVRTRKLAGPARLATRGS